ncbi:uncharacterized protein [Clytia hemisphaerica]|uniref:uncharacterized protein n=1 Tax=Clytia hemisphaerica TaxID=252671 RepID=UPI0034D5B379
MFQIKNGIFQGDSPSGLHFVICLLPLTWLLNKTNIGYKLSNSNQKVSHLMFMDDLKLYAPNDKLLNNLIDIVKRFSDDIKMTFGIDKCNKLTIIRGKVKKSDNTRLDNGDEIKSLNNQEYYKYLGFKEQDQLSPNTKAALKVEYFTRIKKILKTELNSKNTITAINAYAIPALSYGFQIVDWSITELEAIDRSTRIILQQYHLMHHQSDILRIYLPRKSGGRGLINITNHYKKTIINFSHYLQNTNEPLLRAVSNWQLTRGQKSIHAKASNSNNPTSTIPNQTFGSNHQPLNAPPNQLFAPSRNKQSPPITSRSMSTTPLTTTPARICRSSKETIHHIVSGCTALAPTKYLKRHNDLAKYLHILLLQKHQLDTNDHIWYNYTPPPVIENHQTKILWDFSIQTDHHLQHNKPDILILHKNQRRAIIVDIAVPNDSNIANKRIEKIRKYTDLAIELKAMWNLDRVEIVPFVIGATGVFYKQFDKDIEKLELNVGVMMMPPT